MCVWLSFAYGCPIVPALLVEKIILSSVNCLYNNEGAFPIKYKYRNLYSVLGDKANNLCVFYFDFPNSIYSSGITFVMVKKIY